MSETYLDLAFKQINMTSELQKVLCPKNINEHNGSVQKL